MATYIFLNVPGQGYVNPTLAVAKELRQRGERVIYYLTEDYRAAIEAAGVEFRGYESKMGSLGMINGFTPGAMPDNPLPSALIGESEAVMPQVLERIRLDQPDVILYDTMSYWGKIAARALHVPAILTRPTFASDGQPNPGGGMMAAGVGENSLGNRPAMGARPPAGFPAGPAQTMANNPYASSFFAAFRHIDGRLADLCRAYAVEPFSALETFFGSEALNIVFIPKEFQPGGEKFDPQRFVFVGPSIQPRPDDSHFPIEQLKGHTTLYISLGTVFNNQAGFFNMCFAAFKDGPWQVVVAMGSQIDPTALDPIPANFIVRPYVPQLEVLPHTSLFVTHCGMGNTMESLYYGVPMVGVPQMPEQMMTARRIRDLGLGTSLDMNTLTVEQLRDTVKSALSNEEYRKNAQAMQQHVRNAGGYQRAADAIMNFAHSQHQPME
jgi:MGT family glycosyltransferase